MYSAVISLHYSNGNQLGCNEHYKWNVSNGIDSQSIHIGEKTKIDWEIKAKEATKIQHLHNQRQCVMTIKEKVNSLTYCLCCQTDIGKYSVAYGTTYRYKIYM